mgnify:CR=1 FL=1
MLSLQFVVFLATGGGTGVMGFWKLLNEVVSLCLIYIFSPIMICVLSENTPPLVNAFESDATEVAPVDPGETLAYGVNVPGGVGHFKVLSIIRESGGMAIGLPEGEINKALSTVWKDKGWWVCPEGAACLAAIPHLLESGLIKAGDKVVAFNTGSLEKYLPDLRHLL